ncbi:MAG: hypothetical protein JZU58_22370 [Curvibacter lanceolatus]|uniref:hypothetical protein n=1 Tax=Curvibacter lanceolatus TaxID=86182 RepID=UPI002357246C|nr:hypothetical protein [Curvibacter lanceolatus]MBV5295092.1 hypothetical protein [Curvibacter lanceolatus]
MPNKAVIAPKSTEKKKGFMPFFVAAIAGILAPGAYLLGYSYYEGYMNAFGVETDGFPVSAPNVYVLSYQTVGYFLLSIGEVVVKALDGLLVAPIIYWAFGALGLSVGGIFWLLKAIRKEPHPLVQRFFEQVKRIISWLHWENNDFTKSIGIVGVASYSLVLLASVLISIALFWWLLPLSAYAKGKEVAANRIELFREKGCHPDPKSKWDNCFFIVDETGRQVHEGLLIAMNDSFVAILKKDGSYLLKRKDGYLLRRQLH